MCIRDRHLLPALFELILRFRTKLVKVILDLYSSFFLDWFRLPGSILQDLVRFLLCGSYLGFAKILPQQVTNDQAQEADDPGHYARQTVHVATTPNLSMRTWGYVSSEPASRHSVKALKKPSICPAVQRTAYGPNQRWVAATNPLQQCGNRLLSLLFSPYLSPN